MSWTINEYSVISSQYTRNSFSHFYVDQQKTALTDLHGVPVWKNRFSCLNEHSEKLPEEGWRRASVLARNQIATN